MMQRFWVMGLVLAVAVPAVRAQQPDSAGPEDADVQALRAQIRDINRQLIGEMLSGAPDNDHVNQLILQRQETRMHLEQLNRDEDKEMAGYLSPLQRVRYQQERTRLQERIAEFVRHRREQGAGAGGGARMGPLGPRRGAAGRPGRKPKP